MSYYWHQSQLFVKLPKRSENDKLGRPTNSEREMSDFKCRMLLGLRGMIRNFRALSATAEPWLAECSDGRLKTDLALGERDDRDDHTPCAS